MVPFLNYKYGKKLYRIVMKGGDIKIRHISNNCMFVPPIETTTILLTVAECSQ